MPILARYLLRLYLPAFGLCLAVCTAVLLMNHFLRLFNLAVVKGIPAWWILACFARLLPFLLGLAVPIAFMVALLLTLGVLSENGEILTLRSSGYSFGEILWPFLALAAGLSAALLLINHKLGPDGYHSFKNRYETAVAQVSQLDLEPGTFTPLGDWKLFAERVDRKTGRIFGVYMVKLAGRLQNLRIDAPEGTALLEKGRGFRLELYRGTLRLPEPKKPEAMVAASFDAYRIFVPLTVARPPRRADMQELNTPRLRERLSDPGAEPAHRREYLTEIALRTAAAMTPLVFFWAGCPLGLRLEKHARATGFALSLVVLFVFYGFLGAGIGLGRRHLALSSFAPWLPIAAGVAAGAWFWRRNLAR